MNSSRSFDWRGLVLPLLLLAAWTVATAFHWVDTRLIVPPAGVLRTAWRTLTDPQFQLGVLYSVARDLSGFVIGASAGVALGTLLGMSRWADHLIGPTFHALRQVSLFAWLPLLSSWLGYGEGSKLVFIALSALYPVALGTFEGVRGITLAQAEVARVFGFNRWQRVFRLVLPAASPQIASGLTLGLVYAWVATIGSEFLLANWGHGLGNIVIKGRAAFNVELIVVGMLAIGLVGTVLNRTAARLQARALHWRRANV
ncbi:ABC transporter permease [Rhizobacter sp. LjRoot28]|uniref:ABC transporter permease n=1 Tax=Rhizobacter sp. LjRoot28 TaxID=3342309 RepID=UPI003ED138EA